jgi:hypothetical protein
MGKENKKKKKMANMAVVASENVGGKSEENRDSPKILIGTPQENVYPTNPFSQFISK